MKETKRGRQKYKMKYTEKNMSIADFYNEKNFYISVEEVNCIERERERGGWNKIISNVIAWNFFLSTFHKVEKRKKKTILDVEATRCKLGNKNNLCFI